MFVTNIISQADTKKEIQAKIYLSATIIINYFVKN